MAQKYGHALYGYQVQKFLPRFPDLQYDGSRVYCAICAKHLLIRSSRDCRTHVNSAAHIKNRKNPIPYTVFLVDFLMMLVGCNIPFYVVRNKLFKTFWKKYISQWDLPSNSLLQKYLPRVREFLDTELKREFRNKNLWLIVGETTDSKKNSVVNVLVRTLSNNNKSPPYLVACKRIQQCTAANIQQVVLDTLNKFEICKEQVLMLVTDGDATMLCLGRSLKEVFPELIHVTCILHAFHLVAETVRASYTNVDHLITSTKAVFHESPKRISEFHKCCPYTATPPESVLTRWGTWLDSAFYYMKNYQEVKSVVMKFNPKEAAAIRESQRAFQNPQTLNDLQTIYNNYKILREAIKTLQNDAVTVTEALYTIQMVDTRLQTLSDVSGIRASTDFKILLQKNLDLDVLKNIYNKCSNSELLSDFQQQLLCTNITSLVAEQSFSLYENLFSSQRQSSKDTTIESCLMLQVYARRHPEVSNFHLD